MRIGYIVERKSAASSPTSAAISASRVEALAPERRAGAAGDLGDPLERQAIPAPLAQDVDRRDPELLVDLHT